ncbi:MAG TPA: hypothetical protein VHV47_11215 [Opitutaceae bacterium]|jgi:hypothetical protein|nr:hypothetical protein [Opitutaceae bacterium]
MKTSSIEILEKSQLPADQAHAILRVLEQEMTSSQEHLATKADLNAMGSKLAWMVLTCFLTQLGITVTGMALLYAHVGN